MRAPTCVWRHLFSDDFPHLCADCGVDTTLRGRDDGHQEYYMVHDDLWHAAGVGDGYLCVGCLERRIGRRLTPADFTGAPTNDPDPFDTPRLAARKAGVPR